MYYIKSFFTIGTSLTLLIHSGCGGRESSTSVPVSFAQISSDDESFEIVPKMLRTTGKTIGGKTNTIESFNVVIPTTETLAEEYATVLHPSRANVTIAPTTTGTAAPVAPSTVAARRAVAEASVTTTPPVRGGFVGRNALNIAYIIDFLAAIC